MYHHKSSPQTFPTKEGRTKTISPNCANISGYSPTAAEPDATLTWHVIHDHVEVVGILEGIVKLHYPFGVGMGHYVPLLPEERRVRALDHFKFGEKLHRIHSVVLLHPNLVIRMQECVWGEKGRKRVLSM